MANHKDYADSLRDAFQALALIPVAGLDSASFWFKEWLDRTTQLTTAVVSSVALARSATSTRGRGGDPAADVLAQDLLEASRAFVRSMVSLPADTAIFFTGDFERQLAALLQQFQPDASTDLPAFTAGELQRLLEEFDRLSLAVRAEALKHPRRVSERRLVTAVDGIRARVKQVSDNIKVSAAEPLSLTPAARRRLLALNSQKARGVLQDALRQIEELLPESGSRVAALKLGRVESVIDRLGALAKRQLAAAPARRGETPAQRKNRVKKTKRAQATLQVGLGRVREILPKDQVNLNGVEGVIRDLGKLSARGLR